LLRRRHAAPVLVDDDANRLALVSLRLPAADGSSDVLRSGRLGGCMSGRLWRAHQLHRHVKRLGSKRRFFLGGVGGGCYRKSFIALTAPIGNTLWLPFGLPTKGW
jgi:hypothetical protein